MPFKRRNAERAAGFWVGQVLALDVVNPAGIDVSLDDIGGLEGIKSTLVSCAASLPALKCICIS